MAVSKRLRHEIFRRDGHTCKYSDLIDQARDEYLMYGEDFTEDYLERRGLSLAVEASRERASS